MVLIIQCEDRVGLVADIATVLANTRCKVVSMFEHVDSDENKIFVRIVADGIRSPQD
jgi:formyltetrahydrofolate deformylase